MVSLFHLRKHPEACEAMEFHELQAMPMHLGDRDSQFNLGVLFSQGWGVQQDYEQAAHWYKAASDQGAIQAMANLGMLLQDGGGVPQDYLESARLLKVAAEHGNVPAQHSLAAMYKNGHGVPLDHQTGIMWYFVAYQNGFKLDDEFLGSLLSGMTKAEIDGVSKRVSVCIASDYADCE